MSDVSDTEVRFRLDSAQLYLTYTKCDLDHEDILNYVKFQCESKKKNVKNYLIVREPNNNEIHAYFQLDLKLCIRDPHFFDIDMICYNKLYRPSIEGVRSPKKVMGYLIKSNDYISNMAIDTLDKAINMISSGKTMGEIAAECPKTYVSHHGGLEKLKARVDEKEHKFKGKPFVEVHYGDKNCGKSSYTELYSDDIAYRLDDIGYFDGYDGQEILIFDEFNGNQVALDVFLKITSGQQRQLNVKGKKVINKVRHVIVTSNKHPKEWYKKNKYNEEQSDWRLDCIWKYIKNGKSFSQRKIKRNPYTFTQKKRILNYLKKIDYPKKFPESLSHDEKIFVEGYMDIPYNPKFDEDSSDDESSGVVVHNKFSENHKRKGDDEIYKQFDHENRNHPCYKLLKTSLRKL
ncbi:26023_t:CDS:1 [Racocetra persica]|uniref:26023_t:CDS:1 n=1 Tax=Racocetra persica TaxID=160502 RepID=A0ACA9PQN6_9GLOM|nr:26023_t:CDS:1 [Racocetra persica]